MRNFVWYENSQREGKPKEKEKDKYHEYGNNGSLLLRLFTLLFMTGRVVILDSGCCMLLAVLALNKMGVFPATVIKKSRYWPRYMKVEEIKAHF